MPPSRPPARRNASLRRWRTMRSGRRRRVGSAPGASRRPGRFGERGVKRGAASAPARCSRLARRPRRDARYRRRRPVAGGVVRIAGPADASAVAAPDRSAASIAAGRVAAGADCARPRRRPVRAHRRDRTATRSMRPARCRRRCRRRPRCRTFSLFCSVFSTTALPVALFGVAARALAAFASAAFDSIADGSCGSVAVSARRRRPGLARHRSMRRGTGAVGTGSARRAALAQQLGEGDAGGVVGDGPLVGRRRAHGSRSARRRSASRRCCRAAGSRSRRRSQARPAGGAGGGSRRRAQARSSVCFWSRRVGVASALWRRRRSTSFFRPAARSSWPRTIASARSTWTAACAATRSCCSTAWVSRWMKPW